MNRKQILIAASIAFAGISAGTAQAHAKLQSSQPQASSTLDSAPKAIRLQFNEALEPAFSKISLSDSSNKEIALPKAELDKADSKAMIANLPVLSAGKYHVKWSTLAHDGHKTKGEFDFTVK
jgi:methionine-rich copper-binding protein CopC